MFAPTLPYQVEAGAWDPSWGPSSDTRGGVSYLLLGGMGSWLPKWCPLTRGRGIVPYYPWAGMTALTPYLAVTPVRWGGPSAWPPQREGTLAPHVGVGGRPVFSRGVCRAEGGYCLKGLCFARLPLSWSFGWKGFHWGILVAATGVSELLLPSALNLRYMRQKENPGRSHLLIPGVWRILPGLPSLHGSESFPVCLGCNVQAHSQVESVLFLIS